MKTKRLLLVSILFFVSFVAYKKVVAQPYSDSFLSEPVSEDDGDFLATKQVTASTSAATLLDAAEPTTSVGIADRSYRRRSFFNHCNYSVFIGTNSAFLTTQGYELTPSTGTYATYVTYNKAAVYGTAVAGSGGCTIDVIKETNSIP